MSVPQPPGLQQERTLLAWRRTVLSFAVLGLVLVRTAVHESGQAAAAGSIVLVVLAAWLTLSMVRGRRWTAPHLTEPQFRVLRGGELPATVTVIAVGLSVVALLLSLA